MRALQFEMLLHPHYLIHHALTELQTSFSVFSDTIITSRNNPRIRQLRALLKRPERERTGLALIEGLRLVTEALQYPDLVHQLIVAPELLKSQHGQELLQDQRKKAYEKEEM